MREEIPESLAGERLDRLLSIAADVSRSVAADAISNGLVQLDGVVATKGSVKVSAGQIVEVEGGLETPIISIEADPSVAVEVLYVDDDVIIVDKSDGDVVHPGAGNERGTLIQGLLALYPEVMDVGDPDRPGVVHRLDKGTTGVFMVARSAQAYESLTDQLRARTVHRRYLTLAWGRPETGSGVIDAPIGRAIRDPTRMTIRDDGKPARTHYRLESSWDDPVVSLLACTLETGRTHQIRVHLEAIGHPVVGDPKYRGGRPLANAERPALHAAELGFDHPNTGDYLEFASPLPRDMVERIESYGPPSLASSTS